MTDKKFPKTMPVFIYAMIGGLLLSVVPLLSAFDGFTDSKAPIRITEAVLLYTIVVLSIYIGFEVNIRWQKYSIRKKVAYNLCLFIAIMLMGILIHGPVWKMAFPFDESEAFLHSSFPTTFFFRDTFVRNIIIIFLSYYGAELYMSSRENFAMKISMSELETENVNSQLSTLMNQLNPHFLFNSLNTLSGLIEENPDKSQAFIAKLSEVLRFSLAMQENNMVNLSEEISFAKAYTFLLKVRFEDKINIKFELNNMSNKKVPSLCTQLLLENVTKHNLMSAKKPIEIEIKLESDGLSVCNNLNPLKSKESLGYGLKNLNKRCELLIGKPLIIEQDAERFRVKVPYFEN